MGSGSAPSARERPPAVAGTFYPRDPALLREAVEGLLARVAGGYTTRPKALVVPHAGYLYSGPVAASAYAQLRAPGARVERVVLLGPSHFAPVAGLALPDAEAFRTPLGLVPLDGLLVSRALQLPQVTRSGPAHLREHSLEVQLPFLQLLVPGFTLVPLVVGHATPADVAGALAALWGGPETLVVVSTDLSHYLPYDEARAADHRTASQVLALDVEGLRAEQACGCTPLRGLLLQARRRRLDVDLLDLRSSGDTAGTPDQVVGYAAFALHEPRGRPSAPGPGADELPGAGDPAEHRRRAEVATALARAALHALFGGPVPTRPADEPWLLERRACFVSLHRQGALRGCIGALEPRAPLFDELLRCTRAAAQEDPRFPPLSEAELPGLEVEVSVLSPLQPLPADDEAQALSRLRPGVDGLVLAAQGRQATFIPAMWEQLPDPRAFLAALRHKAGLPDRWLPGTRLFRFSAERYQEAR